MRRLVPALACLAWLGLPNAASADGLMLIQAGAFWMGRDGGPPEEAPLHRMFVTDFWIERHKVTNAEFAEFLNARGWLSSDGERRFDHDDADARIHRIAVHAPQGNGEGLRWRPDPGFERHPAVEVSWFGARDYCRWKGRRLPTEAEWEKAARGDDGRPYPWGAAAPSAELAVYGRPYNATAPTDDRPRGASPYGIHDMVGNLREWTATILRPYPYKEVDGRASAVRGEPRPGGEPSGEIFRRSQPARGEPERIVVRGASHDDPAEELSCATSEDLGGY